MIIIIYVYLHSYLPLIIYLFIMDACPSHMFESTEWIEMKLG